MAITDVLIAAERLVRDAIRAGVGQIEMPVVCTERRLKREAVPVTVPAAVGGGSARRTVVIPDAWFQLQIGTTPPVSIALELDRGHVEQKRWRAKVAALCAWAGGPYQTKFETDNLTVAVVTPTPTRRDELLE